MPCQWPGQQQQHQPVLQESSYSRGDGFPSGGHSFQPARQAAPLHQPFEAPSSNSTAHVRGPAEHASFSHARAPSSGYGVGSYSDGAGAGPADSVDYSSMIPDPALRQSFSQNVEEVRALPLMYVSLGHIFQRSVEEE